MFIKHLFGTARSLIRGVEVPWLLDETLLWPRSINQLAQVPKHIMNKN
jgi:hypothetical protein